MSKKQRTPLFTVVTPISETPFTLYQDTWEEHVLKNHPDMAGKEDQVHTVCSQASLVAVTPVNPDYYMFVNTAVATPSGKLLSVFADPTAYAIATAFYNRSATVTLPVTEADKVIWKR